MGTTESSKFQFFVLNIIRFNKKSNQNYIIIIILYNTMSGIPVIITDNRSRKGKTRLPVQVPIPEPVQVPEPIPEPVQVPIPEPIPAPVSKFNPDALPFELPSMSTDLDILKKPTSNLWEYLSSKKFKDILKFNKFRVFRDIRQQINDYYNKYANNKITLTSISLKRGIYINFVVHDFIYDAYGNMFPYDYNIHVSIHDSQIDDSQSHIKFNGTDHLYTPNENERSILIKFIYHSDVSNVNGNIETIIERDNIDTYTRFIMNSYNITDKDHIHRITSIIYFIKVGLDILFNEIKSISIRLKLLNPICDISEIIDFHNKSIPIRRIQSKLDPIDFRQKYLKYKEKYLKLKHQLKK